MRPALIDSAVFVYALGEDHELKKPCRAVIDDEELELCATVEMVQEVVFHRMRMGDGNAIRQAQRVAQSCRLYAFDREILDVALSLIDRHGMGGRDAVHAATALRHGIPEIISPDPAFDGIEGLTRLDPREMS